MNPPRMCGSYEIPSVCWFSREKYCFEVFRPKGPKVSPEWDFSSYVKNWHSRIFSAFSMKFPWHKGFKIVLKYLFVKNLVLTHVFPMHPSLPLKTENFTVFWCFPGVEERCIGNEWVMVFGSKGAWNRTKKRFFKFYQKFMHEIFLYFLMKLL